VRRIRDSIGRERFGECIDRGAGMTYEELTALLMEVCDEERSERSA